MNILITGGRGQLGHSIRKIGAEVPQHTLIYTDLPEGDIADREAMLSLIESNGIELIVNCAAYTAVDKAESEPDAAWRVNALGAGVLGTLCAEKGIGLIHISTDYVFDGTAQTPYTEDTPLHPLGVYGKTKAEGERMILESGCRAIVIRTAWLYSEFGNNFVKTMLRLGTERDRLTVVDDQSGSPTYAPDLARAVMVLADRPFDGFTVYHFSDEGETTWYDFARKIFELTGNPIPVLPVGTKDYPTPARRPAYSVLSKEKIKAAGATVPDWMDSLKICVSEIKKP
jgi:dTDP-4-dehydrorhamnose reductase